MKIKDKVLIVEDEQSISNFISMILTYYFQRPPGCF